MTTALTDQDFILLSAYIDGELAPTESRKLEDRIANCPVLTRQFNIMAGQSIVLRNQSERLLPDALYPKLSKNIEDILDSKPIPSRVRTYTDSGKTSVTPPHAANGNTAIWTGIGAAAAVLIAFVGGNWFSQNITATDVASLSDGNAQLVTYSPVSNPVLDQEISLTLEKTLSGAIRHVALDQGNSDNAETLIEPLRTFRQSGRFCREYQVTFPTSTFANGPDSFYGRACRTGDGQWETVYRLIPGADLPEIEDPMAPKQKL
ncbi:hypothetical protein ACQ0MK_12165 [Thalassospira lucentensis]|uniref:anti-sigma factor n=1 Tax=Thalassospira lucentensis TaxID=168935 RepID=UPI003D2EA788